MKSKAFALLLPLGSLLAYGQVEADYTLLAGGGNNIIGSLQVEWSIGELITNSMEETTGALSHGILAMSRVQVITGDIDHHIQMVEVWPNPFREVVLIKTPDASRLFLNITDLQGRKVPFRTTITDDEINLQIENDLEPGIYLLNVFHAREGRQLHFKLIRL
ncbi:MAG: T9SS type A sorting domain-containing protein [Cyclobacteriaceae bacterium]